MTGYYGDEREFKPSTKCLCRCTGESFLTTDDSCPAGWETDHSTLVQSGQFTFRLPLMAVGSLGAGGWGFTLDYLAGNGIDSLLGPNFNFTQHVHLEADGDDVWLVKAENTRELFTESGGDYSSEDNNTSAVLTRTTDAGDDYFTLTAADGTVTIFDGFDTTKAGVTAPGRIRSITDRYDSGQQFAWTETGGVYQLESVTDAYERTIEYTYYGSEHGYKLKEIEDFLERKLNFQYDDDGHLVAVVTPSITKGAPGNTFPGGMAYVFQYDVDNPREDRRNDLIRIWYPNQATAYVDAAMRTADVDAVYANATPRYVVEYGQDPTDDDHYGRVVRETVGDPNGGPGGTYSFVYTVVELPSNLIDPNDLIMSRTMVTDRNGNQVFHDFNDAGMVVRREALAMRSKLTVSALSLATSYVTWTKYNSHNQPLVVVYPEGNSVEYEYDDGTVTGFANPYPRRIGLLKVETQRPGNALGITSRAGSGGQSELTRRYFYDPLFGRQCAVIEHRGNPIVTKYTVSGTLDPDATGTYERNGEEGTQRAYERNGGGYFLWYDYSGEKWIISVVKGTPGSAYWQSATATITGPYTHQGTATGDAEVDELTSYYTPQNGGTPPTDGDRSRYTTVTYFDYQQDSEATVKADSDLQAALGLNATEIGQLIDHVQAEMANYLPASPAGYRFDMDLGDINGDGTGGGDAPHLGNVVKIKHPSVRQLVQSNESDPWRWATQEREELFTVNARGQTTTHTDPEGDLTVYVRYPFNDPEGDGQFVSATLTNGGHQYGRLREVHVDTDPHDVMSLVGADGDLTDFTGELPVAAMGRYVSAVLVDSPKAYWRLGDADGATAADISGNALDGAYAGGYTVDQDGALYEFSRAVTLNGSTGYVDAPNTSPLQIDGDITLEAWVKVSSFPSSGSYSSLVSKGYDSTNTAYWLAIHNDGGTCKLIAGAGNSATPSNVSWTIENWTTGHWVHVAVKHDGTDWTLFFNGAEVASAAAAAPVSSSGDVYIGAFDSDGTPANFLDGSIAEAAIYAKALSDERIQAHYQTGTAPSYLDLTTRYQGIPGGAGCSSCGYDALGNVLSETDPRGFTTVYDRNELGEAWRVTSPAPYNYRTETYFDANRNVTRTDVEDKVVAFDSDDPTSADYAKYAPTGSGSTAHVPTKAGEGGTDRPGWFCNYSTYDLLDNPIESDVDATGSTPARLETTYEYDPNQNLIKVIKPEENIVEYDYDERDLQIATRVGYDPDLDVDEDGAVTITIYDGNGNVIDQIGPVDRLTGAGATTLTADIDDAFRAGESMTHIGTWIIESTLDGFDRVTSGKDAVGNVANMTHDPDGRVVSATQEGPAKGSTPLNRNGTNNVDLASGETRYDEAGRTYESQQDVFLNTGVGPIHTLDSVRSATHTGGGLEANSTTDTHTDPEVLTSGNTSYVLTRTVFDRAGRVVASASDNAAVITFEYDGASRQIKTTFPQATNYDSDVNDVGYTETTYDANSNAIRTVSTEYAGIADAPTTGVAIEVFESLAYYDALNRVTVLADQGADGSLNDSLAESCTWPVTGETLVTRIGYDSRSNQTLVIDPKGNTAVVAYDGASRAIESIRHLRDGGNGGPPPANATLLADGGATVRTVSVYDGNGRLIELIDDRGASTLYTYDTLDRQTVLTFHDGSTRTTDYNAASDVTDYTDENSSVFDYIYDAIGRPTTVTITPAKDVMGHDTDTTRGTTAQSFQYDGLGRRTQAIDTTTVDTADSVSASADFAYDSLNRLIEDGQDFDSNTRYVTHTAFESLVTTEVTYPDPIAGGSDTGRTVDYEYDELYRRDKISDTVGMIAEWAFFGAGRVAELNLGNGLICTHMNNARTNTAVQADVANSAWGDRSSDRLGYDGAGRMITKRYLDATASASGYTDNEAVVGFTTAYDHASNRLYERHLRAESRSHAYPSLDSMGRLLQYQRGTLQQAGDGSVTVATAITLPSTDSNRSFRLDGVGNWQRTTYTAVGSAAVTEVRRHNHVNQLTQFGTTALAYDHGDNSGDEADQGNGNIADDGTRLFAYDALNRVVTVTKKSGSLLLATYTYDGLGRRVRKVITNGGLPGSLDNDTIDFVYDGVQCIDERDPTGGPAGVDAAIRQYVWGAYVDELIQQIEIEPSDASTTATYYPLSDLLYRTTALTDGTTKAIVEAYDCDAYGNTLVYDTPVGGNWFGDGAGTTLAPKCSFIFTGRRYDAESSDATSQMYFYRARYYNPALGRFLARDPIGYEDGMNLYEYVGGSPVRQLDPRGLDAMSKCDQCVKLKRLMGQLQRNYDLSVTMVLVWERAYRVGSERFWLAEYTRRIGTFGITEYLNPEPPRTTYERIRRDPEYQAAMQEIHHAWTDVMVSLWETGDFVLYTYYYGFSTEHLGVSVSILVAHKIAEMIANYRQNERYADLMELSHQTVMAYLSRDIDWALLKPVKRRYEVMKCWECLGEPKPDWARDPQEMETGMSPWELRDLANRRREAQRKYRGYDVPLRNSSRCPAVNTVPSP